MSIFFFALDAQLFQHYLLERLFLSHCIVPAPLSKISLPCCVELFVDTLFCPTDLCVGPFTSIALS